jgi:uncharacterized protein (TIGR00661 family)
LKTKKTYLVCPLNWGLGHATRLIPIIQQLLNDNHNVLLGGDGDALILLSKHFHSLQTIHIPDIHIRFNSKHSAFKLIKLIPHILSNIIKEHFLLKKIIAQHSIGVVISDNRYGLWNKKVESVFITHQLMLKLPAPFTFIESIVHGTIKKAIKKYNQCWIPDYPDSTINLSGDLSHKYPLPTNAKFIGPLSRFSKIQEKQMSVSFQIVALLSGPEPTRSELQEKLIAYLSSTKFSCLIIEGQPNKKRQKTYYKNITSVPHISDNQLKYYLKQADYIFCRSGYSTIMDLHILNCKAIIIPTPGQTEQEYLAHFHKNTHLAIQQKHLLNTNIHSLYPF